MGYDNPEVFFGKHHDGQDVIAGFRFIVPVAQGTVLSSGSLLLYLEEKYPEGVGVLDYFTDDDGTLLTAHTMDVGPAGGWLAYMGTLAISDNTASNRYVAPAGAQLYGVECGAADGTVKGKVYVQPFYAYLFASSLAFRIVDTDNYWRFGLNQRGSYNYPGPNFENMVDGIPVLLAYYIQRFRDEWDTYQIWVNEDNHKVQFINEDESFNWTWEQTYTDINEAGQVYLRGGEKINLGYYAISDYLIISKYDQPELTVSIQP